MMANVEITTKCLKCLNRGYVLDPGEGHYFWHRIKRWVRCDWCNPEETAE